MTSLFFTEAKVVDSIHVSFFSPRLHLPTFIYQLLSTFSTIYSVINLSSHQPTLSSIDLLLHLYEGTCGGVEGRGRRRAIANPPS